jgi:flagellar P-ring protein FlgI
MRLIRTIFAAVFACMCAASAEAGSRIKDIADFEGVRENMLVGYGLVVGLAGTGDSLRNAPFTRQSLEGMLERLGINVRGTNMQTNNVAAVMVTAALPPFARQGARVDVAVSALGDSKSLQGGMLLVTPLMGADGEVYAVAQGPVAIGGFTASGQGQAVTKGTPTHGKIPNGAMVEREIGFELASLQVLRIGLRNPDFTTASRIAQAINRRIGVSAARATDPSTVVLSLSEGARSDIVGVITELEQLIVEPDQQARVVIDEKSGIVVIGKDVRVDTVAIAQGNLTIKITETPQVSQPQPFSQGGQTVVVPRTQVEVDEGQGKKLAVLNKGGVSLQDLVDGLNALGVTPRDLIMILQTIKAAGALQAEVELR